MPGNMQAGSGITSCGFTVGGSMSIKGFSRLAAVGVLSLASLAAGAAEDNTQEQAMWGPYPSGFALGGSIGTTGLGLDLAYAFNETLSLRAALSGLGFDRTIKQDDFRYKGSLSLFDAGLYLDISPFNWRGFFFTLGAVSHNAKLKGDANCSNPAGCNIDGTNYSQAEIGSLSAVVKNDGFSPYLGLGMGTSMYHPGDANTFFFRSDFGVIFSGKPKSTISATGTICNSSTADDGATPAEQARAAQCRSSLVNEQNKLADDVGFLKAYPVVKLVFGWSF